MDKIDTTQYTKEELVEKIKRMLKNFTIMELFSVVSQLLQL